MAWLLMVIPRSFSKSISSSICPSVTLMVFVASSKRSARVDLPWSICAIIQKFLICFIREQFSLLHEGLRKCKVSASRAKKQIYLHFSETQPNFDHVNVSASRAKKQIYLYFSETQPNFDVVNVSVYRAKKQMYLQFSETQPNFPSFRQTSFFTFFLKFHNQRNNSNTHSQYSNKKTDEVKVLFRKSQHRIHYPHK